MIEVNNIHKAFGKVIALRGVSFSAPDGQITGLLGPNGAGKTTTLRVLSTRLRPDQGTACVDGLDTQKDALAVQHRLGALPDSHGLYPRLTARENIRYYGKLHGLDGKALEARIDELILLLDMQAIADRRADGFSTGERMKVAIGRALVHRPNNILLDEPTNGLDVMSTRAMRSLIQRLRDEGRCVLFSSHIMQEVSALCDQVVVIAHGQKVAAWTSAEIEEMSGQNSLENEFVRAISIAPDSAFVETSPDAVDGGWRSQ
ncbi:MAG: ATP-binding cassette domain-containing protein [Chloroflexi bacterium]|nr:MAG: ATP-binding cassette domain-containing protein [Chloroflexota bacterium]